MVYPALLPLMSTSLLPVVDRIVSPADLNGLVRFAERRNLVSARVPSHFKQQSTTIKRLGIQLLWAFYHKRIPPSLLTARLGLGIQVVIKIRREIIECCAELPRLNEITRISISISKVFTPWNPRTTKRARTQQKCYVLRAFPPPLK